MTTKQKNNQTKIPPTIQNQIRQDRIDLSLSYPELAKKYRISAKTAWNMCNKDVTASPQLKKLITALPDQTKTVTPPKLSEGKKDALSVVDKAFEFMYYKIDLELTNLQAGAKAVLSVKDVTHFLEVAAPFAIPKVETAEGKGKGKKSIPESFDMFKPKSNTKSA